MTDEPTPLRGAERQHLRGLAHSLSPVVQVGKGGVTDEVIATARRALDDHELIKVALHRPKDKKALAGELADRTGAQLCGLVGHRVILYRAHPERPRIVLPKRRAEPDEESVG